MLFLREIGRLQKTQWFNVKGYGGGGKPSKGTKVGGPRLGILSLILIYLPPNNIALGDDWRIHDMLVSRI